MTAYFLDTSAIVKRYVKESGSGWLQTIVTPTAGHSLFVASITLVETVATITRRGKSNKSFDVSTALADFHYDFARQYLITELPPALIRYAAELAGAHALRGYDAVQLATALEVKRSYPLLTLISADGDLNEAAVAKGLLVENPNDH